MTNRWNDDRLDRLADSVAANTRDIAALKETVTDINESLGETNRVVLTLSQNVTQLVGAFREQQESNHQLFQSNAQILQMIVQEIRGLRAENRKILGHLFGEQPSE